MTMLELVKRMEGRSDAARRAVILEELRRLGWPYRLQDYRYAGQEGSNIIVDLNDDRNEAPHILLVAHYDVFGNSPGANDDASGIAVLLEAAGLLREQSLNKNVRLVFFDDEEPTEYWRRPIGSSVYVSQSGIRDVQAVIDLEMCGIGDAVGIWPVEGVERSTVVCETRELLTRLGVRFDSAGRVPGFYADYVPFREAGLTESICLTTFPWKERKKLFRFAVSGRPGLLMRYLLWKYLRINTVPTIFRHYHSDSDRSEFVSESSLQMMVDVVSQLVLRLDGPRQLPAETPARDAASA